MTTITIEGGIFVDDTGRMNFLTGCCGPIYRDDPLYLGDHTITAEIPDDKDPTQIAVAELEKKRTKARADFQATMTEIDRRINELTAITMDAST